MNKKLILIFVLFLLIVIPIAYSATDFTENMKSCWNWDGDATDDYGSWDGSVTGATNTPTYGGGLGGGAYHFITEDSIAIGGNDKNFNSFGNTTILVCTNTTIIEETSGYILSADGDDADRSLSIYLYNGLIVFNDNQGGYGDTATIVADGEIRCVVLTWNTSSTTKKMYIDGILNATDTSSGSYDATVQVYFGRRQRSTFGWFTGWIGISAYWENRTFSDAEVAELETALRAGEVCSAFIVGDLAPPVVNTSLNISQTNIRFNDVVNLSANITDEIALSSCQVIINQTGSKEYFNYSLSGTNDKCSQNITISVEGGNVINFTIRANDTSNNWRTNDTIITVIPLPPVVIIGYPSDNNNIDNSTYPLLINGTVTVTSGVVNYTWINNTNWKNTNNNYTNFNFTMNGTVTDGETYYIMVLANNSEGVVRNDTVYFTVDFAAPNTASSLDNNHTLFSAFQNMTFQINFTDNVQVYFFNISTPEGFIFNITGLNTLKYIYNGSINVSAYGIGKHYITSEFCDAHTSKKIPNYQIDKDIASSKLTYTTPQNDSIGVKLKSSDLYLADFGTYKKTDRYVFWFDFGNEDGNWHTYTFKVDNKYSLDYVADTDYKGHFVTRFNWIDFEFDGNEDAIYYIKETQDNKYEIEITTKETYLLFKSIGDLNCDKITWEYYIFNYTTTYDAVVVETVTNEIKLIINFKDIILDGNGTINYYGIGYNASTITAITQINFTVNVSAPEINQNTSNITFYCDFYLNTSSFRTINYTQLIQRVRLATCGALTDVRTLNISIFNEENPTEYLIADVDAVFTVWTNNTDVTLNFTFDLNDHTNYSICIYPNTTLHTNAYFLYNTSSGFRQRWYLTNAKLTTNTSLLYLYNFNTQAGISELRGTLRNTNYEYFSLVIAKLQRYYSTEHLWRTVQMDKSDDFGQILFHVKEITQDYRFIFEKSGTQIDDTNSMKFICTSAVCTLTFIVEEEIVTAEPALYFNYGYNNVTEIFQLNWSDTTGLTQSIRLVVSKETGASSTTICDTTTASNSGTINCDTSGHTGTLFAKVYKTQSPEVPVLFILITKIVDAFYKFAAIGAREAGIWAIGLSSTLITGGAMIGGPVGAIIAYIFSLIIINWLHLFSWVTIGFITLVTVLGIIISILLKK